MGEVGEGGGGDGGMQLHVKCWRLRDGCLFHQLSDTDPGGVNKPVIDTR